MWSIDKAAAPAAIIALLGCAVLAASNHAGLIVPFLFGYAVGSFRITFRE